MRLRAPTIMLTDAEAVVGAVLEAESAGVGPVELWFGVPRHLVGSVDLRPSAFVPVAALLALLHGEPLTVAGGLPGRQADRAGEALRLLGPWVDRPPVTVTAPAADPDPDVRPAPGVGLFFTRGVDSWASLHRHRHRVTHLLTIDGIEPDRSEADEAAVWAGHEHAAAELGLPLVRITTNARQVLDPLAVWDWTHGAVLATCGLLLSPLLGTVVIAGTHLAHQHVPWGSTPGLDPLWGTDTTVVEHDGADLGRWEKTASLVDEPLALGSLHVCWEGGLAGNCGRCEKCLRTMTTLDSLGVLDRVPFDAPLTAEAVAALPPVTGHVEAFVEELLAHLGPGNPLRGAWASLLASAGAPVRVRPGCRPMAGPGLHARLAPTLDLLGHTPVAPSGPGDRPGAPELSIGWGPGQMPLRPAAAKATTVLARLAGPDRPILWLVAEPHDPEVDGSTGQVRLVDLLTRHWGPGLTYLPGVAWAPDQPPGLDPGTVGRMLLAAKVRLWWRDEGTLDPLRAVESIEHGCLPLQVMPAGAAVSARRSLPVELSVLIADEGDLAAFDPSSVAARRAAAAGLLLAGSVERDLAAHLGPPPGEPDRDLVA
jgi:hypothetical protein